MISFVRGIPASEFLAVEELADCARAVLERDGKVVLSYGWGAGYRPLREVIGEWFEVSPDRVLLTNGGLQGLALVTQHFGRGQTIFVENPTYDRSIASLLDNGMSVVSTAMDEHGLIPDQVERALRANPKPAFIYTIPTFQNPCGRTLPLERRRQIVEIAGKNAVPLFEDDPYRLIRFEGKALPTLFELAREDVIYSSSFSKTVAPGLRVGWIIVPESMAKPLIMRAMSTYITPALVGQATVYEFIRRGRFEPNLGRINEMLKARRDAMLTALDKHFAGATWSRPEGGYFIWLELPPEVNAKEVLERAEGVAAAIGTDFGGASNTLRLAYSCATPEEIGEGIARLAAAV